MQKLLFFFFSLFIIFFACTQQNQEPNDENGVSTNEVTNVSTTNVSNVAKSDNTSDASSSAPVVPKKIKPIDPNRVPKPVPQAPKEDLVYPKSFKKFGIPMFKGAKVTNNIILENSKGKFGQRIMIDCPGKLQEVFEFYDQSFQSNGWERISSMDREKEDNDFKYRSALYTKDGHNFSISLMDVKKGTVAVNQILKEI